MKEAVPERGWRALLQRVPLAFQAYFSFCITILRKSINIDEIFLVDKRLLSISSCEYVCNLVNDFRDPLNGYKHTEKERVLCRVIHSSNHSTQTVCQPL